MTIADPISAADSTPAASLWRNRDYMLRFSSQTVSVLGSNVSQIAFPLLIIALTHSPAQAGFAAAIRIAPYLLLSLLAGALVDRWNRKRTMILCDAGRAIALGSIPLALWTGHLTIVQLYVVSLVEGSLMVFFSLSNTASLPRIINKEQLPAAMSQDSMSYQVTSILGPPLGGLLYGLGRTIPFLTDTISYAASVIALLFIKTEFQGKRTAGRTSIKAEIVEGLIWLWRQPLVRTIGFLSVGAWVMLASLDLVVIVLARQHHAATWAIGLTLGGGGLGGILGSFLAGPLQRRFGFGKVIIACSWVWAAGWPLYALAPNVVALGVVTGILFVVWPIYNVTQMSYRIALIPDHLQGRVNSVFRLIAFSGQPIGFALSGVLLQFVGSRATVLILALAPLSMAVAATRSKHVRHARPISEIQAA